MNDFSYTIVQHLASFPSTGAWTLELNLISWAGRPATFDLRKWNADHSKMSKGVSMSKQELDALGAFLAQEH